MLFFPLLSAYNHIPLKLLNNKHGKVICVVVLSHPATFKVLSKMYEVTMRPRFSVCRRVPKFIRSFDEQLQIYQVK